MTNTIYDDPWRVAYELAHGAIEADEVGEKLVMLLSNPINSREYMAGLDLLKAVKSQAPLDKQLKVYKRLASIKEKILEDTKPETVIDAYLKNHDMGMGLLTLLEIYPLIGLIDELEPRLESMTIKAFEKISDPGKQWSFLRAIIYGPAAVLTSKHMIKYLDFIKGLHDSVEKLVFRIDLLNMIIREYPIKILAENTELIERLSKVLISICNEILSHSNDLSVINRVYSDFTVLISSINGLCRESEGRIVCEKINELAGHAVREVYEKIGPIMLESNNQ